MTISLMFIRVPPPALTWIKKNKARFGDYLNGELSDADDRKLMKEIGITLKDREPFDIEEAEWEAALAALGTDGKLDDTLLTMSPAAVKRVKLPEVLDEYDIQRMFKGAAQRGSCMLILIEPQVEEVREAPSAVSVPTDTAGLVAMLQARISDNFDREAIQRIRTESLKLIGVNLSGQKLKDVLFWNADLSKADLSNSKLVHCRFHGAKLDGANLSGATLDMPGFDEARLCGANLTGTTIKDGSINRADLSEISAQGLKLSTYGGVMFKTKLAGADLRKAKIDGSLYDGDFRKANFAGAVMKGSQLLGSNFAGCDLTGADLREAGLQNANFTGATIDKAKFEGATYTKKTKWPGEPPKGTVLVRK